MVTQMVGMTLTCKSIFYYTVSGKTEAALDKDKLSQYELIKLNNLNQSQVEFNSDVIIIGTPTYGRGVPPLYFQKLIYKLTSLKGKKIGLFGSGNTIYGNDFGGALDLIEELVIDKNEVIFKFKFEGMPRQTDIDKLTKLIMEA
jgi:flavodoxin I